MTNNSKKNFIPKKPNKPNFQLWIIIALGAIMLGVLLFNGSTAVESNLKDFERRVVSGQVKTVIYKKDSDNGGKVEYIINPDFYDLDEYKADLQKQQSLINQSTELVLRYQFISLNQRHFSEKFDELEKRIPEGNVPEVLIRQADDMDMLVNIGIMVLFFFVFWMLMRRMTGQGGPGGQIFNIGKSKAALFDADNKVKINFNDVAGLQEAKEEIQEIVEFLKNPTKFTRLGGKIPKGALLVGPPGTGKTLLAKAVAGEAEVPFFSLSGSDFVEMFVGVGAARVRDLFKQAKEKAPCIIFIDEIDAIGRSRGKGQMPGGNDERENTLNSLLVEMDGFATDSGIIIMAATNRPDVLDSALLRPGRFDRQISVDKPDIVGRDAIFQVHLKPVKIAPEVDSRNLASQTPGFAGAEIANVCNEAALIAARRDREFVTMQDFQDAIDRVIGGLEKKNKLISPEEKKIVAYHEAGHAVTGWYLEHADPLVKVSIVPRGTAALGYAQYLPKEQFLHTTEQLMDEMCMTLGGRAAEEIVFGKISTGALSDLERITKMAYGIVTIYGMNEKIGNVSFYDPQAGEYNFTKPYSEDTARTIDEEVRNIIQAAYVRTKNLLIEKRSELEILAQQLLQKEVIFQKDLVSLIGPRPFENETSLQAFEARMDEIDKKKAFDITKIEEAKNKADDKEETREEISQN